MTSKKAINLLVICDNCFDFFFGTDTLGDQLIAVLVENILMLLDDAVHDGLCKHRLVDFVVTVTSVANLVIKDNE